MTPALRRAAEILRMLIDAADELRAIEEGDDGDENTALERYGAAWEAAREFKRKGGLAGNVAPASVGGVPVREVYWLAMALLTELDAVKGAPWLTGALGVSNAMARLQQALARDRERYKKTSEPNGPTAVAVEDGKEFVRVPREPTAVMIQAGNVAYWEQIDGSRYPRCKLAENDAATIWKAMLDAAMAEPGILPEGGREG